MDGKLQSKQKIKNKGFTLIELLVVVAIIGILAAVGVVAYSGYTSGAKKSTIKQNYKTIYKKFRAERAMCSIDSSSSIYDGTLKCSLKLKAISLVVCPDLSHVTWYFFVGLPEL